MREYDDYAYLLSADETPTGKFRFGEINAKLSPLLKNEERTIAFWSDGVFGCALVLVDEGRETVSAELRALHYLREQWCDTGVAVDREWIFPPDTTNEDFHESVQLVHVFYSTKVSDSEPSIARALLGGLIYPYSSARLKLMSNDGESDVPLFQGFFVIGVDLDSDLKLIMTRDQKGEHVLWEPQRIEQSMLQSRIVEEQHRICEDTAAYVLKHQQIDYKK